MGSIINRAGRWRAQVRRKGHKPECRTFDTEAQAKAWVRQREGDLTAKVKKADGLTLAALIRAYRGLRDKARPISDSSNEHYQLKTLERLLGEHDAAAMSPDDLVTFAATRRDEGAGPYTINMDVSRLGTVLRYGGAALKVALPDIVGAARPMLNHLRLIGGGGKRERRPTADEMQRITEHMGRVYGAVYADAVVFSACSAMRRGEVCALKLSDIGADHCAMVARKHPRKGKVMERVPLTAEAWDVVRRQPKSEDGRIFPIEAGTLSKYFTFTCRALSIPDLHLHDMRHEGTSRLFEAGYSIPEVALVTGHKSLAHLTRYTNLRPEDVAAKSQSAAARAESK
jgi:integrase